MQCSNCETEVDPSAVQCPACGAQFEEEQSALEIGRGSWITLGAGVVIVTILSVLRLAVPVVIAAVGVVFAFTALILAAGN